MEETIKKTKKFLRPIKITVNIILLFILVMIGVQNAHVVEVSLMWWSGQISLTLLVFISGLLGLLIALMYKLIKW